MYRYGEDFNEEKEVDALLAQFLQKKRSENNLITNEVWGADEAADKNIEKANYIFDR